MYGNQVRGIERSTFVIDRTGKLCKEWRGKSKCRNMSTKSSSSFSRSLDVCPLMVPFDEAIAPLMPLPKAPTKPATVLTSIPPNCAGTSNAERPHQTVVPLTPVARALQAPILRLAGRSRRRGCGGRIQNHNPQKVQPRNRDRSVRRDCLCWIPTCRCTIPPAFSGSRSTDVFLPMMTLEELDLQARMSEVARSARPEDARSTRWWPRPTPDRRRHSAVGAGQQGCCGPLDLSNAGRRCHAAGELARR